MKLINPSFEILPHLPYDSMLALICKAGVQCYKVKMPESFKDREQFIKNRLKMGHESIIEHVGFSVLLTVDRGITHELVRHRLCAFTQESTRYCNYNQDKHNNEITYVMPMQYAQYIPADTYASIKCLPDGPADSVSWYLVNGKGGEAKIDTEIATWASGLLQAESFYLTLATSGTPPELARGVLPNALAANIVMTANMREWRHIFNLRALAKTGRPHPQMVEIMTPLFQEIAKRFPVFFSDL